MAETIFFYHPAVWYLAAALRTERGNCCDDIATQLYGGARLPAQALSAVADAWPDTSATSAQALPVVSPQVAAVDTIRPTDLAAQFEARLRREGLVPDGCLRGFVLTFQAFIVNGQPQPAEVAAEYRHLHESATVRPLALNQPFAKQWSAGLPPALRTADAAADDKPAAAPRTSNDTTAVDPWAMRQQQLALLKEIPARPSWCFRARASPSTATSSRRPWRPATASCYACPTTRLLSSKP